MQSTSAEKVGSRSLYVRTSSSGAKVLAASRTVSPASSTIWADTDRRGPDPVTTPSTQKHRPWWMAVLSSGRG